MTALYWHCHACGRHELAQPGYGLGDSEPCVECRNGTAHVMTLKEAAAIEQRRALAAYKAARTEPSR